MTKVVEVAVAILQKTNGDFLLASRPQGKGWAGWWEFPGGKIERHESPSQALSRELQEELGITPTLTQPWLKRRYDYPATHDAEAKTVLLHFFFVLAWHGEVSALEGQTLAWQSPRQIEVTPILPANAPIMHALALPSVYAISNVAEMGKAPFLEALKSALEHGLQLIQVREKQLATEALSALTDEVLNICAPYNAQVILNADVSVAKQLGVHGVHLTNQRLMQLDSKPEHLIVGASCHDNAGLNHACHLQLDFAVVSPVLPTQSHPEAIPLGWETFAEMIGNCSIPIYALGGMQPQHLNVALSYGARGIAMQRAAWQV
jgi:8-oxo-dGTP diphosphatase